MVIIALFMLPSFSLIWCYPNLIQVACHLHLFMESIETIEAKVATIGEKVIDAEKNLMKPKFGLLKQRKSFGRKRSALMHCKRISFIRQ